MLFYWGHFILFGDLVQVMALQIKLGNVAIHDGYASLSTMIVNYRTKAKQKEGPLAQS
jgi:hypothetical protein